MGRARRWNTRGGVLLDLVLALMVVLLFAFVLELVGGNFAELLSRAGKFFGV